MSVAQDSLSNKNKKNLLPRVKPEMRDILFASVMSQFSVVCEEGLPEAEFI